MNLLRPRYLALAFAAYFGVVCYYAAQEGRRAAFGAYGPGISLTVFQTTMVGAVLVLLGLFVTASISPQIKGAAPSRSPGSLGTSRVIRRLRGDSRMPDDYGTRLQVDSAWPAGDEFLADPSDAEMSAYRDLEQAQDAAAVSAALSRLVPTGEPPTAGTRAERRGPRLRGEGNRGGTSPARQRHETALGRREEGGPRPAGAPASGRGGRRGPRRGSLAARAPGRTGERHAGGRAHRADRRIRAACASRHRANEGHDAASPRGRDDRRRSRRVARHGKLRRRVGPGSEGARELGETRRRNAFTRRAEWRAELVRCAGGSVARRCRVRRRVVDVAARRHRLLGGQLQAERLGHPRPQLRMVGPAHVRACLRLLRVASAFDQGIGEGSRRARTIAALVPRAIIQRAVAFEASN